jgi:hypothetical protein
MFTEEHLRGLHLRPRCGASRHSDGEAEGGGGASCARGDWAGANLCGSQEGRDKATCGAEHIPEQIDFLDPKSGRHGAGMRHVQGQGFITDLM